MLLEEIKSELKKLSPQEVCSLIDHQFLDHVLPFKISKGIIKMLHPTWIVWPIFLRNKVLKYTNTATRKALNERKQKSMEHHLALWLNSISQSLHTYTVKKGCCIDQKYPLWSVANATYTLTGDQSQQKPDLIL